MVLVITLYSILLTSYEDHVADKQLCLTCISPLNKVYYYYYYYDDDDDDNGW